MGRFVIGLLGMFWLMMENKDVCTTGQGTGAGKGHALS